MELRIRALMSKIEDNKLYALPSTYNHLLDNIDKENKEYRVLDTVIKTGGNHDYRIVVFAQGDTHYVFLFESNYDVLYVVKFEFSTEFYETICNTQWEVEIRTQRDIGWFALAVYDYFAQQQVHNL